MSSPDQDEDLTRRVEGGDGILVVRGSAGFAAISVTRCASVRCNSLVSCAIRSAFEVTACSEEASCCCALSLSAAIRLISSTGSTVPWFLR